MVKTDTKIYRGRTLEEVLPKIKAELGPDAEIVRQRSGLAGGIGGFFQREMVEVEARPASGSQAAGRRPQGRRFDAYDDEPAVPEPEAPEDFIPDEPPVDEPTAEGLSTPGIQEILRQATPFAEQLGAAERQLGSGEPPPATSDLPPATPFEEKLVEEGIDPAVARELIGLLAPLRASRIALTHMDETTHVGGLVDCAIGQELPISYLSEGTGVPGGLEPAAADKLAALVLQ